MGGPVTQTSPFKFIIGVFLIFTLGLVMVYSSSYVFARENFGWATHFFWRQIFYGILGASLAIVVSKTKFLFWIKFARHFNLFVCFLLALTLIPGVGVGAKGATRWLSFFGVSFQPSELLKISMIGVSIYFFEVLKNSPIKDQLKFVPQLVLPLVLLLIQPDFGTFFICISIIMFMAFLSSFSRKYFYSVLATGTVLSIGILLMENYRIQRLLSFLDPWKNPLTSGFQIIQSFLAFSNGGFWGRGIGNSDEKLLYLPEAHNDFIFSVMGEELGFVGVLFFVGLFVYTIYQGFWLSSRGKDMLSSLFIAGIVFVIALQGLLNMGVVLGLLPTKGLNLPFVSYGGSSLLGNFFGIGLVISSLRYKT